MAQGGASQDRAGTRDFREALSRFATGVTVITTRTPSGALEGITANSFSSVSLDPPLVLWSLRREARSLPGFRDAGSFAVNVLSYEQRELCRHFATPAQDKFAGIAHDCGLFGCPVLRDSLAVFECTTHDHFDGGDHIVFLGRVQRQSYRDGRPLVFSAGDLTHPAAVPDEPGEPAQGYRAGRSGRNG
jgi:flavin reductase (DIM6/NTAB) family NADH-FMN oxidoreductase RutF